ncbi:MAG: ABC transporter substrate-binding protein [Betaproteobacteria bacterium]|nr:ABC transporter substrate-binding protein [Betaproteobacteria bacterium]
MLMLRSILRSAVVCCSLLASLSTGALAAQKTSVKVGFVTFLSGPAAGPFGVPAKLAAEAIVDSLNRGEAPAPYQIKGFGGLPIELVIVDEAGGASKQVAEFRTLVQRQDVDLVIGYIGSGDCLAVAPIAEEVKRLTVLFDCGTPRIFEEGSYKYVFRTRPHATMDAVAAALYLRDTHPTARRIAGINQNYAYGQDSWNDFEASIKALNPDVDIVTSQMPKFGAGQYGSEISALFAARPDVIHSSLWGGDLEAFMLQAQPRNLFRKSTLVLVAGEPYLHRLPGKIPDGTIVGARGTNGVYAPDSPLKKWLVDIYKTRADGLAPNYPAYSVAEAFLGVKAAWEKAIGKKIGSAIPMGAAKNVKEEMDKAYAPPTQDEVIAAFEHSTFESPSGKVQMSLGNGHQAVTGTAYGATHFVDGVVKVEKIRYYKADEVTPPAGVKSLDWIRSGFKRGN